MPSETSVTTIVGVAPGEHPAVTLIQGDTIHLKLVDDVVLIIDTVTQAREYFDQIVARLNEIQDYLEERDREARELAETNS